MSVLRAAARLAAAFGSALLLLPALPAAALDRIEAGALGSSSANLWPCYIGTQQGFFAAEGVELDLAYAPVATGLLQQLAGGGLDLVVSAGMVEPIHAIAQNAPVGILRVVGQVAPYALMAKPSLATLADHKGKTVSLGGRIDITKVYFDRMIAAAGLADGDVDLVFAGATGARFAALQSGAVDATILAPPARFRAEEAGFRNLGEVVDYAADLPFTGMVAGRAWAAAHEELARRFLAAYQRSIDWFYADANRAAAITLLAQAVGSGQQDAAASYELYRRLRVFAPDATISRRRLQALIEVEIHYGDIPAPIPVERLLIPGLTTLGE